MNRTTILVGILIVVFLSTGALLFLVLQQDSEPRNIQQDATNINNTTLNAEEETPGQTPTQWLGLIGTPEGLLSVHTESGEIVQSSHFLPPGVPIAFFQSLTDYDDGGRENFMQLLEDGGLVFKGNPNITSAPKQNTLYIWSLESSEAPRPLFQIQENLRIYLFALSEDLSKVAVISSRLTDDEIRSGDIPGATSYEDFIRVIEQSEEDLRTISIYDISSQELVSTAQLDDQNQIRLTRLIWSTDTLIVLSNQLSVYNPETGQKILSLGLDAPTDPVVVSPDGSRYYDGQTGVKYIRSNQLLRRISAPELTPAQSVNPSGDLDQQIVFLGPAAFSPDSNRILLQAGSVSSKNFMVWEMNIEKGSTRKIGELSTIIPAQNQLSVGEEASTFNFLAYHPSGEKALFAFEKALPNRVGSSDIFMLDLDEQTAQHLAGPFSASNLREVSFIGWYRERI